MGIKWKYISSLDTENPHLGPYKPKGLKLPGVPDADEVTPAASFNGLLWYDSTNNTFQGVANGAEVTLATAAGVNPTADDVYNNGAWNITVDSGACTFASNQAAANCLVLSEANAANASAVLQISNSGAGSDIRGTSGTWSVSKTGVATFASSTITTLSATNATITNLTLGSVDGFTLSGDCTFTTSTDTGSGLLLDGSSVTTGNVLRIEADAAALNGGFLLNCTVDGTSVLRVAEDGALRVVGTAAGSSAVTVVAGDLTLVSGHAILTNGNLTLSDGGLDVTAGAGDGDAIDVVPLATGAAMDLNLPAAYNLASGAIDVDGSTGSGPVIAVAMSGAYTGDYVALDMTNAVGAKALNVTGAGSRTAALVALTDTPDNGGITLDCNVTPSHNGAVVMDIDVAGTTAAQVIDIAFAGAHTGDAFQANMTNAVGAKALDIIGAGTRTASLVHLTDTPDATGVTLNIDSTASNAGAVTIDIDEAGTAANDTIAIDYAGAFAGDAINITMTNAAATAQALVIDGGQTAASGNIVSISSSSAFAGGTGRLVNLTSSGNLAAATSGAVLDVAETGAAQATSYAVRINSTNNEALHVDSGVVLVDESISVTGALSTFTVSPNYVQAGGAANAITVTLNNVAGTAVVLSDGLKVLVDLNTKTLQAGANTLDFNGGGAKSIVSHRNVASNIGTAYAANGFVELVYNLTSDVWMDMSQ